MDVMDAGRLGFLAHPAGGFVGVWQPRNHIGAEIVNEPGSLTWNQLHTRDRAGAGAFYKAVFGWSLEDFDGTPVFKLGDAVIAGTMDMPAGTAEQVPAYWLTIFSVADTDATVAKAETLGGQVVAPPGDLPGIGRFAALVDPQGVIFAIIAAAG
jgi:predicted enzyme related to lactoylglutathione lyase